MNATLKGIISDFLRVGVGVAAVLAVVLAAAPGLNVPSAWVAYVAVAAGVVNSLIGVLKPYASAAVKSVFK